MKLKSYLEKIEQTNPCDIEALVKLSYEVVANKSNLRFESRDLLTELLAEKVLEVPKKVRAGECELPTRSPATATNVTV